MSRLKLSFLKTYTSGVLICEEVDLSINVYSVYSKTFSEAEERIGMLFKKQSTGTIMFELERGDANALTIDEIRDLDVLSNKIKWLKI